VSSDAGSNGTVPPLAYHGTHARQRYLTRAIDDSLETFTPGEVSERIRTAWRDGLPVGLVDPSKDRGTWRLHPPTETVIAARGGLIRTVLCRPPDCDLETGHLWRCGQCDEWVEPPDSGAEDGVPIPDCCWCGADSEVIVRHD
jgi:hypothetical protein